MERIDAENRRYVIGIDLGGTKVLAGVVDEQGNIIGRGKKKTRAERSPDEILERLADCCRKALDDAGLAMDAIEAIGVGAPGPLDPEKGIIFDTPNLSLNHTPLTPYLTQQFGVPAYLDNDVTVGTFGEFIYGAARGKKDIVGIFMGTGIGGGLIFGGKRYHGASLNSGEIGHIKVKVGGALCGCGQRGCLEAYASKTAIIKQMQRRIAKGKSSIVPELIQGDWSKLSSSVFKAAVERNDKVTVKQLKRAAMYTGVALGSLMNTLSPEAVVIGGGMIEAVGDLLMPIIRENAQRNCFSIMYDHCEIVEAALGDDSGMLGAAALAWEGLDKTPKTEIVIAESKI